MAGETLRAVAAQFGIALSPLAKRVKEQKEQDALAKTLANQLVTAERGIKEQPIKVQIKVHSIADDLRAISMHLAGAGKYGAATAHRLSAIAHGQVQKLDDVDPLSDGGIETIKSVAVLTRTANEAAEIPINLLKANKDVMADADKHDGRKLRELTDEDLLNIVNGGG
jgi:type I site-specific restriction endonuclease